MTPFSFIAKAYEWLWQHTTGRPYTEIIREDYHKHPLPWIFLLLGAGSLMGHLFW